MWVRVVAEFIDAETGQRREPGEEMDVSAERFERLKAAGVVQLVSDLPELPTRPARLDDDPVQPDTRRRRGRR